ncbi:hypothetical protein Tco_0669225 [Tanacetum coccineum]
MEEMLYKFIDEGRREHEEMGAFIREFKTTNELLLKERNNSLSELKFEVHGLSRAINNAQLLDCELKGVTTRGGKTTTEAISDTNLVNKEPPVLHHKPKEPNEVLIKTKPQDTKEQTVRLPTPLIHFPLRLEEACTVTMNERCSALLLNKLPSKEKDPGSFTIPCDIDHLHINNALADLGASISLMPYPMYEKLGRPFLATARAMIDIFNKKITLRVGNEEVILDVDHSIKRPHAEDDECYGIDDLDTTIHLKTQELLEDNQLDLFLVKNLEECIDQSDLESCGKTVDGAEFSIRHIEQVNTSYSESQETQRPKRTQNEHLYSASAKEID